MIARHHPIGDRRGSVPMEFACMCPFMAVLFFGSFELTQLVRVYMGLGVTAEAVADLLSRDTPDTAANIADACNGGKLIIAPFSGANLTVAMASVTRKSSTGVVTLDWSDTTCGNPAAISNPTTLAAALVPNNGDSVLIVQANYTYQAATSFVLPVSYTLSHMGYSRPRTPAVAS